MGFNNRRKIILELEALRSSKIICYITSIRENVNSKIADDAVRQIIDHLQKLPEQSTPKLDLFIVSNGGDGVVPWRLIPILRHYSDRIGVLIPFKAYSAATIMALGADEIIMHKFGAMGPIDPTVTNEFNPVEASTNRRLGISVEDVKAYISFIRTTVGINHEEEVIKAIEILAEKVHPLALGNVERFISQSRMIARKLLELHTDKSDAHNIETVVEALASKLYFHGHPINRIEAKQLGLKVVENIPPEVETKMWDLYVDFEEEMKFREIYDPIAQLYLAPQATPVPGFFTELARVENSIRYATVESAQMSSNFEATTRHTLISDPQLQQNMSVIVLSQGWDHELPAAPPPATP